MFLVSSIYSKKRTKARCIVVKTNSFVHFFEEFTDWQFTFEINWLLVQCDLQGSDLQLTDFLDCYVFKTSKERDFFKSLLQGEIQNSIFLQTFPFISPESWNRKLLQLPYNIIITTCLVCERVRKKKDRSSSMSYIKEKLVSELSDISLARQWPHEKMFGSFMFKLTFTIHILITVSYSNNWITFILYRFGGHF